MSERHIIETAYQHYYSLINKKEKMKHLKGLMFVLLMVAGITCTHAQNSGLGFNYQALLRKSNGVLLANSSATLRISLYPGQSALNPTWVETHNVRTDASGCFGITVGKGTRVSGSNVAAKFSDINFAAVYYWMKIEIQEGNTYNEVSFTQLPSAPYSEVAHNVMMYPGMIVPFAGPKENIPVGWLLCDGSAISRSEYLNLYNAIGVSWGEGDRNDTFNLPDLRGMFLRGVSGDSGNDEDADARTTLTDNGGNTGNNVGSYQGDAIRNITGGHSGVESVDVYAGGAFALGATGSVGTKSKDYDNFHIVFDASLVVPVGSDNRPKNVYVNYIIKY